MFCVELSASDFKRIVSETLHNRKRVELSGSRRIPSAVMMVFYERDGRLWLLLTRRTDRVAHHKNQISFPGGCRDPEDRTLLRTALRECDEEIGLNSASIEILGTLDDAETATSNFVITPYVAFLKELPQLVLCEEEVAGLVELPIAAMFDPQNPQEVPLTANGEHGLVMAYCYEGYIVWGATAGLIKQFVDLMRPSFAQYRLTPAAN